MSASPPTDPLPSPPRWPLALFVVLLALVAATWWLPYPPYQDFAGHAGMLALRTRLPSSPFLQQYLQSGSIVGPYGTFLLLGKLFAPLTGPAGALRLIGALSNCALPVALLLCHRRLHRRAPGRPWLGAGYLGLVLTLGHLDAQGLISFLLGLAVFIVAFTAFIELLDPTDGEAPASLLRAALLALATAFTHGFAFLLLLLAAALSLIARRGLGASRARPLRADLARAAVFLPALLFLVAVYLRDRGLYPPAQEHGLFTLRSLAGKVQLLFLTTFFSRLGVDAVVAAGLWLLLGAAALSLRGQAAATRPRVVTATAAAFVALALVAPLRIDFFGSLDLRLICTGIVLAILGLPPAVASPRLALALRFAPVLLAGAMVATLWTAALRFQREARPIESLLAQIPTGTRLLYLPTDPSSHHWAAEPFLHLDKRVLFDRDVLVSNVWLHQGTALRPTPLGEPLLTVTPRTTADGRVPWSRYDVAPWDHVLIRDGRGVPPLDAPSALQYIASNGGFHLFRNRARPGHSPKLQAPLQGRPDEK